MDVKKNFTITAIILTKNEEKNLPQCLESLKWVDEIIVVDSGSEDSTIQIAERYGAKVYVNILKPYYAADQRNWALKNLPIKGEWVLFVDADEVITPRLRDEIIKNLSFCSSDIVGFKLCPKFLFLGKWLKFTCRFPSWHDRICRKGKVFYNEKRKYWEVFETNDKIGKIFEPYLHFGFNKGIGSWINKHIRYAEWKALELYNEYKELPWKNLLKDVLSKDGYKRNRALEGISVKLGIFSPFLRFFYHYFYNKGFLDGVPGLIYSMMMGMYQFMVYLFFIEIRKQKQPNKIHYPV